MKNSKKLEQGLEKTLNALSGLDDTLAELQEKYVPKGNIRDVSHRQVLSDIHQNITGTRVGVKDIRTKILKLKEIENAKR